MQKWGRRTFSMEIGWFWGEIRVLWWRQLINTAVGHYLWGIDTSLLYNEGLPPLFLIVGHYLWGIDTITSEQSLTIYIQVGHYLWGIDTTSLIHHMYSSYTRRTLPMRNWYCQASAGKRHSPSRTLPMRNWYMHLLHLMVESCSQLHQVGHYLWGIDTFQSCSCTFARALMVGHYLWGIDT